MQELVFQGKIRVYTKKLINMTYSRWYDQNKDKYVFFNNSVFIVFAAVKKVWEI